MYTGKGESVSTSTVRTANEATYKWAEDHTLTQGSRITALGKFPLPPAWLQHPEVCIAMRQQNEEHVARVKSSFETKGVLNYHVTVLIWKHEFVRVGYKIENWHYEARLPKPDCNFQVIAGDHTAEALRRLARDYPNHKAYKSVRCDVIVCEKDDRNIQFANSFGGLDNYVASTHLDQSIVEVTMALHDKFMDIEKQRLDQATKKKKRAAYKQTYINNTKFKDTTMGSAAALATKTGEVWNLLEQIFKGKTAIIKGKKPQKLNSIVNFIHMSMIPDDRLCRWLQKIIDGEMIPKQFETKCKHFKKVLRVRVYIVEYIQQIRPRITSSVFEDMCEIYPFCADALWVNTICRWVGDNIKDTLTGPSKQAIQDKIVAHEKLQSMLAEVHIYIYIFIYT